MIKVRTLAILAATVSALAGSWVAGNWAALPPEPQCKALARMLDKFGKDNAQAIEDQGMVAQFKCGYRSQDSSGQPEATGERRA